MKSVSTLQRPLIRVGRVLYVFPELNLYAVEPRDGLVFQESVAYEMAIDVSTHSCTSRVGVSDGSSYPPGAEVLIMSLSPTDSDAQEETGQSPSLYNYILGPSYFSPLNTSEVFPSFLLDDPFLDLYNNQTRNAIAKGMTSYHYYQDRSYGRPADAVAGDFIKANMIGGRIHLGMLRAAIGASDGSCIKMSGLDNSMDFIASRFSVQGSAVYTTDYPAWDYYNRISRYARTISEGLGAYDTALKTQSETGEYLFGPQQEDQQGIFRQVKIDGALVEGSYDLMLAPEKKYTGGEVRQISKTDQPHFGVSAIQRTYDGSVNIQGVKNVGLTRSAYVWAPRELDIEDNNPALNTLEIEPPDSDWSNKVKIDPEIRADYASLMKDARTEHELDRYFTQLKQRADSDANLWKLYTKEEVQNKYGKIIDTETKLEPLSDEQNAYETTPSVEIDDPLNPEEKIKLQALLSCIELDESGAVILHDGYGSEIKMHRGHITFAPAVDLKMMPGRSLISYVPRDFVMRGRQYVEISSDKNDVLIKSQRDMKLLSGNGTQGGQLTLENRGTTKFKAGDREKDTRPSGIIMKSYKGDMSIVAPNMYIGLLADNDQSVEGRKGASSGLLTIDSGRGTTAMSGRSLIGNFLSGVAYIANQSAVMGVSASGVILGGSEIGMSSGSIKCGSPTQAPSYPEVTESGIQTKLLNLPGGSVSFKIDGDLEARTVTVKNSLKADFMTSNTCTASNGSFGNASDTSGLKGGRGPGNIPGGDVSVNTSTLAGILREISSSMRSSVLAESGFTGYGILYSGFFYQQDNKYDTEDIVEARYQRMLRKGGQAKKWKTEGEADVDKPEQTGDMTSPWPGAKATQSVKTISDDGLSSEDLGVFDEAYVINTEK